MSLESRPSPADKSPLLESAIVAQRYYIDKKQKREIAEELGISRFKVARLLDMAHAQNLVHITIDIPTEIDIALGEQLAIRFGLNRAIVVNTIDWAPEVIGPLIGKACADLLSATVDASDVLGVSWGTSLTYVTDAITSLPACTLVQLVGGVSNIDLNVSGVELLRRLSAITGGTAWPLHAPLFVSSTNVAANLSGEPGIAHTLAQYDAVTKALVGVGSWNPPSSALYTHVNSETRAELRDNDAAADICGLVFNRDGVLIDSSLRERTVGISADQLRNVSNVIAVAGGNEKVTALKAALASGIPNTLVTDSLTAAGLLEHDG